VRDTGEIFELVEDIKKISENINSYTPIYPNTDNEIKNIEFFEKYKIFAERTDREIITNMKNTTHL
jgi:hypothetical protein